MHVLVTSDTLTGVWTYTREFVTALATRGVRVTLVSLGEIPLPAETAWMDNLQGLDYRPTAFRLEWMQEAERDREECASYLKDLVREVKPDILHLNQYSFGGLAVGVPRVVVAHGDLLSWWLSVHGREPAESTWLQWYRNVVAQGLWHATAVVAPSEWMLQLLRRCYAAPQRHAVIHHGRNPIFFNPYVSKEDAVLAVGRLWDAGKQVSLLTQHRHPLPVCIVDSEQTVTPRVPIRGDVKLAIDQMNIALRGPQTESQLRLLYGRSSIYAATSRYEPLGMGTLEAAFSRCAIIANDIPCFRELWGDSALYFRENDAASLADTIRLLSVDREVCRAYGNRAFQRARQRFTARQMVDSYLQLYRGLIRAGSAAA
jgi:glycogen synthase